MFKDAEAHAEDDKKKRDLIDARNQADSMVYQTEKMLEEHGDKVDASTKTSIEDAIKRTKTAMEGSDLEEIKGAMEQLQQTSHKLAETMYQQAGGQAGPGPGAGAEGAQQPGQAPDEDVVDADFEEVKENK
jgi:molecular chaperone DnaK